MKIGIVGTGFVGSTAAYALIMSGVGREIVLVDLNLKRAQAEADDLYHAVPFASPFHITAGDYSALTGCRVVIVAAGVGQKPGETRLQLLERNAAVFRTIIPSILEHAPETILLIATNPVDVMTHLAARYAGELGIPARRVIGSGTTLDTARFRVLLSERLKVDPQHIHAYVLGEHGDSEMLAWSQVTVGGLPLDDFCHIRGIDLDSEVRREIDDRVRNAAYHIIEGKGATYYGIGAALARICNIIVQNQRAILTVCTPVSDIMGVPDVTVALPHLLGGDGIVETLPPRLNAREAEALRASARKIRAVIEALTHETQE
jgi:L-lactate dehydrogenase